MFIIYFISRLEYQTPIYMLSFPY